MIFLILLKIILTRAFNSLEWCLNTPPKPHAFISSSVKSDVSTFCEIVEDILQYLEQFINENWPTIQIGKESVLDQNWPVINFDELLPTEIVFN